MIRCSESKILVFTILNVKSTFTQKKIFRQVNFLEITLLAKPLLSRKFCQKRVKEREFFILISLHCKDFVNCSDFSVILIQNRNCFHAKSFNGDSTATAQCAHCVIASRIPSHVFFSIYFSNFPSNQRYSRFTNKNHFSKMKNSHISRRIA